MVVVALSIITSYVNAASSAAVVYFNTPASEMMFDHATDKSDFYNLVRFYETQQSQAYCGVATAVMTLNALDIKAPVDPVYYPYQQFNQVSVLNEKALKLGLTSPFINSHGLTLDEEANLLETYPTLAVAVHHVNSDAKEDKKMIVRVLQTPDQYLIVNFLRSALGQSGGYGHFSLAAAYDKEDDSILVLDVARYKYQPFWVKVDDLLAAMNTSDTQSKRYRGYLIVGKK